MNSQFWLMMCLASAAGSAILTASVSQRTHAAAIVGPARTDGSTTLIDLSKPLDRMKTEYYRPTTIPFPKDNPYTPEKALVGKKLFFDTRLSASNVLSCATCHNPAFGWGDGQPVGVGHGMKVLGRRSPSIINLAWAQAFMWDGRASTLEEQALGPIQSEFEMNLPATRMLERLARIDGYRPMFAAAFPNQIITADIVAKALATYQRTIVSGDAPFDLWIEGDKNAISESAQRGFVLFNTKARCAACHSGWNFTDDSFHDIGLLGSDIGRGAIVPAVVKMKHAFKTPGLREITLRSPFMHDGSIPSLEAVVEHYDQGGVERPSRSDLITPLGLTSAEKADLVAFMRTLNSNIAVTATPVLPR